MGRDEHEARGNAKGTGFLCSGVLAEALPKSPFLKEKQGVMEKSDYELFKAWSQTVCFACFGP